MTEENEDDFVTVYLKTPVLRGFTDAQFNDFERRFGAPVAQIDDKSFNLYSKDPKKIALVRAFFGDAVEEIPGETQ